MPQTHLPLDEIEQWSWAWLDNPESEPAQPRGLLAASALHHGYLVRKLQAHHRTGQKGAQVCPAELGLRRKASRDKRHLSHGINPNLLFNGVGYVHMVSGQSESTKLCYYHA